jgi:hypothetical protein
MKVKNKWMVGILLGLMGIGAGCATPRAGANAGAGMNGSTPGQGSVVGSDTPTSQSYGKVSNSSTGDAPYGLNNSTAGQASSGNGAPPSTGAATGDPMNQ